MAIDNKCRSRILSNDYRDMVVSWNEVSFLNNLDQNELCEQQIPQQSRIYYVSPSVADPLDLRRYNYNNIPLCYTLLDTGVMNETGITQAQNNQTLQLMGEGVMIGFIDTGIDYQNTIFRELDGSTRIVGIWDQELQTGTPPEQFSYGSEYTKAQINEALQSDDPLSIVPSTDEIGHGTMMASLAAGGADVANGFLGAAPESLLAVVKLKPAKQYLKDYYLITGDAPCYQENDIMLAIRYLDELADQYGMPLVLCIGLGTNKGGHNGAAPLGELLYINAQRDNRVIVTGLGNEGDKMHHFSRKLEHSDDETEVEIQVGAGVTGFMTELWTATPNLFAISITSPGGEYVSGIPIRQSSLEEYSFLNDTTRVTVEYKIYTKRAEAGVIRIRLMDPSEGNWKITVKAVEVADGVFHMWLPVTGFIDGEVAFTDPDPDTTMTEPSAVAPTIGVGYYDWEDDTIAPASGRGFTRRGTIKPDFVAPGVNIITGLPGNQFAFRTGSSLATAITAGAAALLTQWSYYQLRESVNTVQIKNMIVFGARQQPDIIYPDRSWGFGALDLRRTFEMLFKY